MNQVLRSAAVSALLLLAAGGWAQAPSVCSSDGQPAPSAVLERFINADCEGCWTDLRTAAAGAGEVALDWIVPGGRGDAAPLSAAARREGLARLSALGRPVPSDEAVTRRRRDGQPLSLRVAHGLAFNGYVGASIELKEAGRGPWRAWLVLVETLPAGAERSPVERNLVRNVLQLAWDGSRQQLFESRPMNIPAGADPDRLRVVGLVEDARGRLRGIAQSRCTPAPGKG